MGPTAALEVQDFEATVTRLKDAGVRFAEEAKSAMCSMSMIVDPDGNSLWIHKRAAHRAAYAGLEIPFVCYPVTDKQRAREFYEGLLGLQRPHADYEAADGFWSEYDAGADTLAFCSYWKPPTEPCMGPAAALEVDDFDEAVSALRAAAVPFAKEPKETPGCHLCIVTDPDGNSLFIHKRKAVHA
jgi:catechol 2,3-dioxygenase-like lactoylglutathione lyase family enzyme